MPDERRILWLDDGNKIVFLAVLLSQPCRERLSEMQLVTEHRRAPVREERLSWCVKTHRVLNHRGRPAIEPDYFDGLSLNMQDRRNRVELWHTRNPAFCDLRD